MSEKYRPSNGTEYMDFDSVWCGRCKCDAAWRDDPNSADPCPILSNTFVFEIDDPDYPPEWQYGADGFPCCTAFTPLNASDSPDPDQLDMFP